MLARRAVFRPQNYRPGSAACSAAARGLFEKSTPKKVNATSNTTRMFLTTDTTDHDARKFSTDLMHEELSHLRLSHSKEAIPYTEGIELSPLNTGSSKLGHKKVTVIGCGQVGMAIAYAMLNQTVAGTIALVDVNAAKLEGEAKDLEQGSAFHQHVRILASDNYVSLQIVI
jgi:hypothetical protein